VAIGLAVVGVILPVMPATVFLLLAAACYARGSQKFYDWLLHHKWFGPPIKDWQRHKAMTVKSRLFPDAELLPQQESHRMYLLKSSSAITFASRSRTFSAV
jgi:hypothetical protein